MPISTRNPAEPADISIRPCTSIEDFRQCQSVQRAVWNDPDEDIIPTALFAVAHKTGGHVFGAFSSSNIIGFALAFAGRRGNMPLLHSHIVGILPQYQNRGIGLSIKLRQREDALKQNISVIEWTFDPLALRNAHFNITQLGAVVRRYIPNLYGITSSPLHGGLPTDRLLAEWNLGSERVAATLAGNPPPNSAGPIEITVPATRSAELQQRIRSEFQTRFEQGYVVTRFRTENQQGIYSLELNPQ